MRHYSHVAKFQVRMGWTFLVVVLASVLLGGCPAAQRTLPNPMLRPVGPAEMVSNNTLPPQQNYTNNYTSAHQEWLPNPQQEVRDRWEGILIHHTATNRGCADYINQLHIQRGWDGLGYDFVINNGTDKPDGLIEVGWRWRIQREGAHCRVEGDNTNYWNEHTIGIALIGNFENYPPSAAQYASLTELVRFLMDRYHITPDQVKGHRDIEPTACPGANFDMERFRQMLRTR
ncbi:MAG: N-acetylmuramoyl-L-alanine amidase [Sedimentisphaerales bacterium]|nr:N-acetylmuramoyl-L-alanine amidase [Sedimentisphaerales bacterium]